jgi:hypothetical protein
MYSSSSDLAKFGRAIMLSAQLPSSVTRRWMKPITHTSRLTLSVGAPWEIWRTQSNISTGHTVDLYTKGGSIGLYNSLIVLIPDYQVSIAILSAGPEGSGVNNIAEMVIQTLLPVLHQSAREGTTKSLVGEYIADAKFNSSTMLDSDDLGLVVKRWISNGSDLLDLVQTYSQITGGGHVRSVRLYPTDLVDHIDDKTRVGYRILFDVGGSERPVKRVFDQSLNAWGQVDQITYGKTGVDDVVVEFDGDGHAVSIEPRVLGLRLLKTLG